MQRSILPLHSPLSHSKTLHYPSLSLYIHHTVVVFWGSRVEVVPPLKHSHWYYSKQADWIRCLSREITLCFGLCSVWASCIIQQRGCYTRIRICILCERLKHPLLSLPSPSFPLSRLLSLPVLFKNFMPSLSPVTFLRNLQSAYGHLLVSLSLFVTMISFQSFIAVLLPCQSLQVFLHVDRKRSLSLSDWITPESICPSLSAHTLLQPLPLFLILLFLFSGVCNIILMKISLH